MNFRKCPKHEEVVRKGCSLGYGILRKQVRITLFFKRFYLFLETGEGRRKRGRETSIGGLLHAPPLLGTRPHNPGTCPDWESNWRPFSSQASTPSTEPHHQGGITLYFQTELIFIHHSLGTLKSDRAEENL